MKLNIMVICACLLTPLAASTRQVGPPTPPRGKWYEPSVPSGAILPTTGVHDTGLLTVSIDDVGGQEAWRYTFYWPDTASVYHLFWNWLAVGLDSSNVFDAPDQDWHTTVGGQLVIQEPGPVADEEGLAEYADYGGRIRVSQHTYAWDSGPDEDYLIISYTVVNTSGSLQDSVFIGHRTDFDVLGDHGSMPTDMSSFDSLRLLACMWDTSSSLHAGVSLLDGPFCGYHVGWYTLGGDPEKYHVLSWAGADAPTPYPDDWCIWLSTGPYRLAPGDSCSVAFAFVMGEDLADLRANADAAQAKWLQVCVVEGGREARPTRRATTFCRSVLSLHGSRASILTDASGRKVMDLPGAHASGASGAVRQHDVGALSPGVYFVSSEPSGVNPVRAAVTKIVVTK